MLENLSSILKRTTDKIANAVFLDKNLVDSVVKDLQRALIEADVNVQLVLTITKKIKQAALDERITGIEKKEHIIKLLHDELIKILGTKREIQLQKKNIWLMFGLDVYRPAASEQLKQLCDKLNIPAFIDSKEKDPKKILKKFQKEIEDYNIVIIDTAGRDALSEELVKE